jgi:hypothetical protein
VVISPRPEPILIKSAFQIRTGQTVNAGTTRVPTIRFGGYVYTFAIGGHFLIRFTRASSIALFVLAIPFATQAGTLVLTQAGLNPNDSVLWSQLGPVGTLVDSSAPNNTFTANSARGDAVTVTTQGGGVELANPSVWNLPTPDLAIDNQFTGTVNFTFSTPVSAAGFYLSDAFGSTLTTAAITEFFQGGTSTVFDSLSSPAQVIFIGISDPSPTPDITGISIATDDPNGNNYFSFGTLFLQDDLNPPGNLVAPVPPGVPEPSTFVLAGSAVLAIVWWHARRRRKANQ